MRLIQVYEIALSQIMTEKDICEIGIEKMKCLLPLAKNGLTQDIIELAKNCTVRELRRQLGHKVIENDGNESVICGHCGATIMGAKWTRKSPVD